MIVARLTAVVAMAVTLVACAGPTLRDSPDVPFVVTPTAVVQEMLDVGGVTATDVVYDLGSGDGRIVIAAARRGARGVGVELDPRLVQESRDRAFSDGLAERATFVWQDIFKVDLSPATVVTLYLFPEINARLAPKLTAELRPGARIVSHRFPIPGWTPVKTLPPDATRRPYPVYLYVLTAARP